MAPLTRGTLKGTLISTTTHLPNGLESVGFRASSGIFKGESSRGAVGAVDLLEGTPNPNTLKNPYIPLI